MENENEEWRPIHQFTGLYEVSNLGRIRNVQTGYILRGGKHRQGYILVTLCRDGKAITKTVHSIVAENFIGPRPTGMVICHWNDNPADNRASNLRYATQRENYADAKRNNRLGDVTKGSQHHKALLDEMKVRSIRQRLDNGDMQTIIAKDFGVGTNSICAIKHRKTWKHVD